MTETDYKRILEQARADLLATQVDMGECLKQQEALDKKIAGLRATIAALARMLDQEFVEEDEMGLTDAIREAFRSMGPSGSLAPVDVKGRLEMMGYNTARYGNVMASVHTVINRLAAKGEIKHIGSSADGKPHYQMPRTTVSNAPPPVHQVGK